MKSTKLRRAMGAAAMLAVATLAISGCAYLQIPDGGGKDDVTVTSSKPPVVDDDTPKELVDYYSQELTWEQCSSRKNMDCTTVKAPMDYADPSKGDIELAVVRLHAGNGKPVGSLLTNPGGPGGSGYSYIYDYVENVVSEDIQDNYDVIGFDPRGVGESTAVKCFDGEEMDHYLYDLPTAERNTEAFYTELDENAAEFAAACEENTGELLEFITTENSARDMDLLRAVLGDEKLNYLGFSYGTFLGATYAKLFPEKVGRLVLDGALDPGMPGSDVGKIQAIGFESALRAYMEDCLAGTDCPFSGTVDEALADLQTFLLGLDKAPLEGTDGRMLGADTAFTAVVVAMYAQESWSYLSMGLSSALEGDADTMLLLADAYNGREGDGLYADNSTEAFNAYNCMDYPDDMTDAEAEEVDAYVQANAPTIYPFWSGGDTCATWAYPASGVREDITADGAAPILVVGTTNDPATPYEWAVALADQLSSGVLLTRVGEGHTGYGQGNDCIDTAVDDYLIDGTVPKDDTTCK